MAEKFAGLDLEGLSEIVARDFGCPQQSRSARSGAVIIWVAQEFQFAAPPSVLNHPLLAKRGGSYLVGTGVIVIRWEADASSLIDRATHELVHFLHEGLAGGRGIAPWIAEGYAHVATDELHRAHGKQPRLLPYALSVFRYRDAQYRKFDPRDIWKTSWPDVLAMSNATGTLFRAKAALVFDCWYQRLRSTDQGRPLIRDLLSGELHDPGDIELALAKTLEVDVPQLRDLFFEHCRRLALEARTAYEAARANSGMQ